MKKILLILLIAGLAAGSIVTGCRTDPAASPGPDSSLLISFAVPQGWPQPLYQFQGNTLTQDGFELGRKLFYDPRLSRDNTISCGSCHQQFAAFAHLDHSLSHGIDGLFGTRNSPALYNLAWHPAFFWDGNVSRLEDQPVHPIENPVEMDEKMGDVLQELHGDADYKTAFRKVFGDETMTAQGVFKALSQFMGAMVSANSRYDKYIRGENGGSLTTQEMNGLTLFRQKCAACHTEPLFTDFSYRNNGLVPDVVLQDSGRALFTHSPDDKYKFKVPSLRNVELSRPYMHDGRFNTLDAAVEHYRTDIFVSLTLDPILSDGIVMTDGEKSDIVSFLKTLTDTTFTKDKRFSENR